MRDLRFLGRVPGTDVPGLIQGVRLGHGLGSVHPSVKDKGVGEGFISRKGSFSCVAFGRDAECYFAQEDN